MLVPLPRLTRDPESPYRPPPTPQPPPSPKPPHSHLGMPLEVEGAGSDWKGEKIASWLRSAKARTEAPCVARATGEAGREFVDVPDSAASVIILQDEAGCVGRVEEAAGLQWIMSTAATTCTIACFSSAASGRCAVAHVSANGDKVVEDLVRLVASVAGESGRGTAEEAAGASDGAAASGGGGGGAVAKEEETKEVTSLVVELDVLGSFDGSESSKSSLQAVIDACVASPQRVRLRHCLVGVANQKGTGVVSSGAGLRVATREWVLVKDERQRANVPLSAVRGCRPFHPELVEIGLDLIVEPQTSFTSPTVSALLSLRPFPCETPPEDVLRRLVSLDDTGLTRALSTSPRAEPPYFATALRQALRLLQAGGTPLRLLSASGRQFYLTRDDADADRWTWKLA